GCYRDVPIDIVRMRYTDVARDSACPRCHADRSQCFGGFARHDASLFKSRHRRGNIVKLVPHLLQVAFVRGKYACKLGCEIFRKVPWIHPGSDHSFAQPVAAPLLKKVDDGCSQSCKHSASELIANVGTDGA